MSTGYRVLDDGDLAHLRSETDVFGLDVLQGLSELPKRLPSKYFYDDAGSRYFERIMDLDQYYLTGCEASILATHRSAILAAVHGKPFNLVDLGAGDGKKTLLLLEQCRELSADVRYVPIDISEGAMRGLVDTVRAKVPGVVVEGLVCDYADGLRWINLQGAKRSNLVLFLGSNIGNFNRVTARGFLRSLWNRLNPGDHVLVGFDLKKDIELLLAAYNDREGVTAAFNINLLTRINRELGGNFDVSRFRHFGTYDVFSGAMASYLVSREQQRVYIEALQHTFEFAEWEPVHTEYSYKYLESDIDRLAADTGFSIEARYFDDRRYFVDDLWRVRASHTVDIATSTHR